MSDGKLRALIEKLRGWPRDKNGNTDTLEMGLLMGEAANVIERLTAAASHLSASSNEGWRVKPLEEWREDCGFCLWWTWTGSKWLGEPSYIGSPLCDDWPGYHTHWTPHPEFPPLPSPGEEQTPQSMAGGA